MSGVAVAAVVSSALLVAGVPIVCPVMILWRVTQRHAQPRHPCVTRNNAPRLLPLTKIEHDTPLELAKKVIASPGAVRTWGGPGTGSYCPDDRARIVLTISLGSRNRRSGGGGHGQYSIRIYLQHRVYFHRAPTPSPQAPVSILSSLTGLWDFLCRRNF